MKPLNIILGLAFSIGAVVLLYFFNPVKYVFYPPCPFRMVTGLYCPGCGSVRALHRLLHGDIFNAVRYNPLIVLSLPFLLYSFLARRRFSTRKKSFSFPPIPKSWVYVMAIIVIVYWILRNLPFYPFTLLAPP